MYQTFNTRVFVSSQTSNLQQTSVGSARTLKCKVCLYYFGIKKIKKNFIKAPTRKTDV